MTGIDLQKNAKTTEDEQTPEHDVEAAEAGAKEKEKEIGRSHHVAATQADENDAKAIVSSVEQDLADAGAKQRIKATSSNDHTVVPPTTLRPYTGNEGVSRPGAWGVQPSGFRNQQQEDSSSDTDDDQENLPRDENLGVGVGMGSVNSEDLLIQAELVEQSPPPEDDENKVLVDAEVFEQSGETYEMKRRRQMIRNFAIVGALLILIVVIVLAVVLSNNGGGDSQQLQSAQQILASSSPTISLAPSRSPSLAPSHTPSDAPSQSPTRQTWLEVQRLSGLTPDLFQGTTGDFSIVGGQKFGHTAHVSDISNTPMGNRTGFEWLVAATFRNEIQLRPASGGTAATFTGASIYLCTTKMDTQPSCNHTSFAGFIFGEKSGLQGTNFILNDKNLKYELYALDDLDLEVSVSAPPKATGNFDFSLGPARRVAINEDGTRIVHITGNTLSLTQLGFLFPGAPFGDIGGFSEFLDTPPPCGCDEFSCGECPLVESHFTLTTVKDVAVLITGLYDPSLFGCASSICELFTYEAYKIERRSAIDLSEDTVPPLITGYNSSVWSLDGLAVNGDATIVAVSSAYVSPELVSAGIDDVDFQVNVYQIVNNSSWERMGSTISGPVAAEYFGGSLSMNAEGSLLVVGASVANQNGQNSGRVYTYSWDGNDWVPFADILEGVASSDFGHVVDLSDDGRLLVIGAPGRDLNGENSGEVAVFQLDGV